MQVDIDEIAASIPVSNGILIVILKSGRGIRLNRFYTDTRSLEGMLNQLAVNVAPPVDWDEHDWEAW